MASSMSTSSNPMLHNDAFGQRAGAAGPATGDVMTIGGTVRKAGILFALLAFAFSFTWDMASGGSSLASPLVLAGGIGGFAVSIWCSFRPQHAPFLAPVFALLEGALLGGISAWFEQSYPGIATTAALSTLGIFGTMLLVYQSGLVKVTQRFRSVVTTMMLGIVAVYLLSFVGSLVGLGVPYIHEGGPIGIGFSLVVLAVASLMLLVDFDLVERGARQGAPRYMEWYGAFALLVTLVWIYLEMLRLLAKTRR